MDIHIFRPAFVSNQARRITDRYRLPYSYPLTIRYLLVIMTLLDRFKD
jgi:hypothetical protein